MPVLTDCCAGCGVEIDAEKSASTSCSKCKKLFCCDLHTRCFSEHFKECRGMALTMLSPEWIINLRTPKDRGETANG